MFYVNPELLQTRKIARNLKIIKNVKIKSGGSRDTTTPSTHDRYNSKEKVTRTSSQVLAIHRAFYSRGLRADFSSYLTHSSDDYAPRLHGTPFTYTPPFLSYGTLRNYTGKIRYCRLATLLYKLLDRIYRAFLIQIRFIEPDNDYFCETSI